MMLNRGDGSGKQAGKRHLVSKRCSSICIIINAIRKKGYALYSSKFQYHRTGSSKKTNFGSPIRAIATLRRRFIPPL